MFFQGIKFGMVLQISIGPVSMFILTTAVNSSFLNSLLAVLAVTLVDTIFILLALLGAVSFLKKGKNELILKTAGGIILILFGANILINTLGTKLIPAISLINPVTTSNSFIYAFILTLSSPLTILFWAGVFSSRVIEKQYKNKDLYYFALGCISSTLIFLTSLSFIGSFFHYLLAPAAIIALNITAGITIIYFGIKMLIKKTA